MGVGVLRRVPSFIGEVGFADSMMAFSDAGWGNGMDSKVVLGYHGVLLERALHECSLSAGQSGRLHR